MPQFNLNSMNEDEREDFDERVAIMMVDDGLEFEDAVRKAALIIIKKRKNND